jgi:hypothetical protein
MWKSSGHRDEPMIGNVIAATDCTPQKFDLIVGDVRRHCHVQWKPGTKIGVKFE